MDFFIPVISMFILFMFFKIKNKSQNEISKTRKEYINLWNELKRYKEELNDYISSGKYLLDKQSNKKYGIEVENISMENFQIDFLKKIKIKCIDNNEEKYSIVNFFTDYTVSKENLFLNSESYCFDFKTDMVLNEKKMEMSTMKIIYTRPEKGKENLTLSEIKQIASSSLESHKYKIESFPMIERDSMKHLWLLGENLEKNQFGFNPKNSINLFYNDNNWVFSSIVSKFIFMDQFLEAQTLIINKSIKLQ